MYVNADRFSAVATISEITPPRSYLAIPITTLVGVRNPMAFVFNSEDNTIQMRQISIGITDRNYVEVTSGLSEGGSNS